MIRLLLPLSLGLAVLAALTVPSVFLLSRFLDTTTESVPTTAQAIKNPAIADGGECSVGRCMATINAFIYYINTNPFSILKTSNFPLKMKSNTA